MKGGWVDGETNWCTITTFRQLADNAALSVKKGERVFLSGRLRIREWESGERSGTTVEIEADSLGHDLSWGTSNFTRVLAGSAVDSPAVGGASSSEGAAEESASDGLAPVGAWSTDAPPF